MTRSTGIGSKSVKYLAPANVFLINYNKCIYYTIFTDQVNNNKIK